MHSGWTKLPKALELWRMLGRWTRGIGGRGKGGTTVTYTDEMKNARALTPHARSFVLVLALPSAAGQMSYLSQLRADPQKYRE